MIVGGQFWLHFGMLCAKTELLFTTWMRRKEQFLLNVITKIYRARCSYFNIALHFLQKYEDVGLHYAMYG